MKRRLTAILAADVVGYSALMSGDEGGTFAALRAHRAELFDPETKKRGGRIVKLIGDGALVEFPSVIDAVECAVAIQTALSGADGQLQLRIGINLGDVIIDGDDIYGEGVNVAARLEALAEAGGICISGVVHESLGNRVEAAFTDAGEQQVKGIARPVRVWRWAPDGTSERATVGTPPPLALPEKPSIAILPFDNMSGDKEQDYFSDGITEDIITDLSRVSRLFVISRNSTFSYKGRAVKAQHISAELGAKFLVEGSVRKSGNRVRVTAQLIDGRTGGHIWAERYDRDLVDVFEVQDDISKSIVDALKIALAPSEQLAIERIPTRNLKAYDRYLRGRQFLREMTKENLEHAREMFADAVALDPEYAIALTGLADCDAAFYNFYSSDRGFIEAAINNSRKALALDPDLAEAHASLGFALSLVDETAAADREFEAAIALDPMLYEAYWYFGMEKISRGDFEEAARLFTQASKVRGDDLQSKMMLMTALLHLDRKTDMRAAAKEAIDTAARRLELNPDDSRAAYIGGFALIHLGDKPRAIDWLNIAARIDSVDPRTTYNLACAYSLLGESEKALDFLEVSINAGRPVRMCDWAMIDPDLAPVRENPHFGALIERWRAQAKST